MKNSTQKVSSEKQTNKCDNCPLAGVLEAALRSTATQKANLEAREDRIRQEERGLIRSLTELNACQYN